MNRVRMCPQCWGAGVIPTVCSVRTRCPQCAGTGYTPATPAGVRRWRWRRGR